MTKRPAPTVLVTGCSSGIGAALAAAFRAAGCVVYASARRLESLSPLKARGVHAVELDVTKAESIEAALTRIDGETGQVDVLVNNAGFGLMGPMLDLRLEDVRQQFETNVVGPIALIQRVARRMAKARAGVIVDIGSVSGILTTPFAGAYCASKAALHAVDEALRLELAPFGIRVMTVQPGAVRSSFGSNASRNLPVARVDSLYAPVHGHVQERAKASQENGTPSLDVAEKIVRAAMQRRPPHVLRLGHGAGFYAFAGRWLPAGLRGWMLARRFGLHTLEVT